MSVLCANIDCDQPGKSKCAACGLVSYCGPTCQKAHWNNGHKAFCKANRKPNALESVAAVAQAARSSNGSPTPIQTNQSTPIESLQIDPILQAKIQNAKRETQTAFQNGEFEASVKHGQNALEITKLLPEPAQSVEAIQISLNLTTAYLQLGKFDEANTQSQTSVGIAEKSASQRNNHPQAVDMLSATLTTRAFVLLNMQKLTLAEECSKRAMKLNEKLFTSSDPRMYKVYRSLGLIYTRMGQNSEAEKYLRLAYDVASINNGPTNSDAQMSADELLQVLMKKEGTGTDEAEAFIRYNYLAMEDQSPDEYNIHLGEGAAKFASILIGQGKPEEAEIYLKKALVIREKVFGPTSHQVAVTLVGLGNLREAMGDVSEATEGLLARALEIFKSITNTGAKNGATDESQNSNHIMNCIAFMRRVKTKREARTGNGQSTTGSLLLDDDEDGIIIDGTTTILPSKSTPSHPSTATTATRTKSPPHAGMIGKDRVNLPYTHPTRHIDPDDGITRMKLAANYFETQEFSLAELCLYEAYEVFLGQFGALHPSTVTAKQNLEIVRQNGLNLLWQEILLEEKVKLLSLHSSDTNSTSNGDIHANIGGNKSAPSFRASDSSFPPGGGVGGGDEGSWGTLDSKIWEVKEEDKANNTNCYIQ